MSAAATEDHVATFVAMQAGPLLFGFYAKLVQTVRGEAGWSGGAPLALASLLGVRSHDEGNRVLLVTAGAEPIAVRSIGPIVICRRPVHDILPLPPLLRELIDRPLVSAVSFDKGEPPLVVLDPIRIAAFAPAGPADSPPQVPQPRPPDAVDGARI